MELGTIDAIATLIHTAAPITTLRSGYKSRSATIFLGLEKAFELVSNEVLLESTALFNMVINQLLQLNLGSKVQMIAYADDLAIHGSPIGEDILYKQMTTALKMIDTKAMQLGLKFSPDKCEALWYINNNTDWNFTIAGEDIPWRASVKYLTVIIDKKNNFRKQIDYIRQKMTGR